MLIYLDTETTDLDETARIVQLAYKNSETGETVNEYFKPPTAIGFGAMAIHHVTEAMVADKPAFAESEQKKKLELALKDGILVAHNALYDMGVLKTEGTEMGRYIDTLRVAQHVIKSDSHKLQYLRYSLDLNVEGTAHDALGDVLVLEKLFEKLIVLTKKEFSLEKDESAIEKMMTLTVSPIVMDKIAFGKHKNKTFEEVAASDRGYLEWLNKSVMEKPEAQRDPNLVKTLEYYLKLGN